MLQRRITVSGFTGAGSSLNGTYIQYILTDSGVTGDPTANPFSAGRDNLDFTNEDFIKMNNRVGGISSKQKLVESSFITATLENRFVNESKYEFGAWANNSATVFPWINVVQEISQIDYSVDPLNPRQTINIKADITSDFGGIFDTNTKVILTQEVDLADPNAPSLGGGTQGFKFVKASGNFQTSGNILDPLLPGGTNGGTVTWINGELVKALWIGQVLDQGAPYGPSTFGLTQYSADSIVNEGGVYQRQVTITLGGVTYIQTIVTDEGATGDPNAAAFDIAGLGFKSENFVEMNSENQGIASILDLEEQDLAYMTLPALNSPLPSIGGQFFYTTELKTGWANGRPLDNRVAIDQRILLPDSNFLNVSSMENKFSMRVGLTQADKRVDLSNSVGTVSAVGNGSYAPITFVISRVTGAFQGTTRLLTDPALLPSTGGTIAWNPYEAIQATWIVGRYGSTDPTGPSNVNSLSNANLSTGDRTAATTVPFTNPILESWVNPFTQPPPSYNLPYVPDPF